MGGQIMKTRISIPLLSCGIVAAGTLFSPSAHADDRMHRVPGMECEIQSDDASYASRLLEHEIVVSPGSNFGPGQERFVRVALAPDLEECREVAEVWPA